MGRSSVSGDLLAAVSMTVAVIRTAFRQQLAYRTAAIGGLVTNAVFGAFLASVYGAVYAARGDAAVGGLSRDGALTYVWLAQALIVPTLVWGSWEIATSIRTGAIVAELLKPYAFFGHWLARDAGRAMAGVLMRFVPTLVVGFTFYPIVVPGDWWRWLAFVLSVIGAVTISFVVRFCIQLVAFWWNDMTGLRSAQLAIVGFLSGFLMPIDFYPVWLQRVIDVLPFRGIIQTPVDVWLGNGNTWVLILVQVAWIVVGVAFAQWLFARAVRKVVVQGG
ncbi:MAG TPA: ABC-2 family transporter protein [Thermomicrobiales bacterium]|jgi:ABC-2 type transport system permease protein|nr:ABC-2 family transporter protein [Thermomicrobiales bacterium]